MKFTSKYGWFILSIFVILLDQWSKYWVSTHLQPYEPFAIIPMLNFTLAFNTGAAFSFLSHAGEWHIWLFMAISLVVSIGMIVWIIRMPREAPRIQSLALSLILGGALANLIDRVALGYVIDFIDVYYHTHHWYIFNLADSAITIGSLLLALDLSCNNDS
jgi:signal peptidase II